jgi:hypothetical protein
MRRRGRSAADVGALVGVPVAVGIHLVEGGGVERLVAAEPAAEAGPAGVAGVDRKECLDLAEKPVRRAYSRSAISDERSAARSTMG